MRHLVIIGTIAVSLGLVAGAQASDWFRPRQQSSQQVDRHAERHDRGRHSERHDSRDHKWRADCTAQPGARLYGAPSAPADVTTSTSFRAGSTKTFCPRSPHSANWRSRPDETTQVW